MNSEGLEKITQFELLTRLGHVRLNRETRNDYKMLVSKHQETPKYRREKNTEINLTRKLGSEDVD
jgi:hypothetical protein